MGQLRIGVMGCANIARRAMIPAARQVTGVKLVAWASRTGDKAQTFAAELGGEPVEGYQQLLDRDDIDAVYMPLPTGLHPQWVQAALHAGKHVLVEKSFAPDAASARSLLALARQRRCCVLENYLFPHHSQTAAILDTLRSGTIGELRLLRTTFAFPPLPKGNFRYDADLAGGALLDAGGYVLKAAQHFLAQPLRVLAASLHVDRQFGVDTAGAASLIDATGITAQCYFGFDSYYQCSLELLGTKGRITTDRLFTPPPDFRPTLRLEWQDRAEQRLLPPDNHYRNMWAHFAEVVASGQYDASADAIQRQADLQDKVREVSAHG